MDMGIIDLHTHSTESDGTLSPEDLVEHAKELGLSAIALTDHDTVNGLPKARRRAKELGIELVPGIELSTDYEGMEVHILGYYMDETEPAFLTKLQEFVDGRERRNDQMMELLQKEGFAITMEDLRRENPDSVITRAHISRYLVEHGFVKDKATVFQVYLGDGRRCYVPREKITPFEAIRLIQLGGGLAFFAHPVLCHMEDGRLRSFVQSLKEAGLAGIEVMYSLNRPEDEAYLKRLAEEYGLLVSGGSDFHGENKPDIQLGTGKSNLSIPYQYLAQIKESAAKVTPVIPG